MAAQSVKPNPPEINHDKADWFEDLHVVVDDLAGLACALGFLERGMLANTADQKAANYFVNQLTVHKRTLIKLIDVGEKLMDEPPTARPPSRVDGEGGDNE